MSVSEVSTGKQYFPYVDGMRAISIFFVIAYHAWLPVFKSGSIGVDVFFIISGFLITSLLLKELGATGTISLKKFYVRRVFRIFPGLVTLLLVGTILQRYWQQDFLGPDAASSLLAGWGMFIDIFSIGHHSANAFNHLWSVHLEEQFYLFWSILLVCMLRLKRVQGVILETFLLIVVVGGFVLRLGLIGVVAKGHSPIAGALQFLVGDRVDHLFLGCLFGYLVAAPTITPYLHRFRMFLQKPFNGLNNGLVILIVLIAQLPESALSAVVYFSAALAAATLLLRLRVESTPSMLKSILSSRPFVFVGKRSYSLYLWHWLVQEFVVRLGLHGPVKITSYILLTAIAAEASYSLIEKPFLRLKERYFEPTSKPEVIQGLVPSL